MTTDIFLILAEDAGAYDTIRHLFPGDRIPITLPFPSVYGGSDKAPCYLIDAKRLTKEQHEGIVNMLVEMFPELAETIYEQIETGLKIADCWCADIEGDETYAGNPAARMMAYVHWRQSAVSAIGLLVAECFTRHHIQVASTF